MTTCSHGEFWCGSPATPVPPRTLTIDDADLKRLGRPIVQARPYCVDHGGELRSIRERDSDWMYRAPACVGDEEAVLDAGTWSLDSTHAYLVIRRHPYEAIPERAEVALTDDAHRRLRARYASSLTGWECPRRTLGPTWRVELRRLGVLAPGDLRIPDTDGQPITDEEIRALEAAGVIRSIRWIPARVRDREHPYEVSLGAGSRRILLTSTRTVEQAIAIGTADWARHVEQTVERIRTARGGTLDWGAPVEPRESPIIVRPEPGESAWDAIDRLDQ